jgi:hypothetical protein
VLYHVSQRLAIATVRRRLAAIVFGFGLAGRDSPTRSPLVRRALLSAARIRGTAQRQAVPLPLHDMRHLAVSLPRPGGSLGDASRSTADRPRLGRRPAGR